MNHSAATTKRIPESVLDCRSPVGESIVWSAKEQALCWVDIVGRMIHRFHPEGRVHVSWATPEPDLPRNRLNDSAGRKSYKLAG